MGTEESWDKANIRYENYIAFIKSKGEDNRFELKYIDLLYISNFKGGGATINGTEEDINKQLKFYSAELKKINKLFGILSLGEISNNQLEELISQVKSICTLVQKEETNIGGFGVSYLSALLSAYFPDLIPIVDKNVLESAGIQFTQRFDTKGIEEMIKKYTQLIMDIWEYAKKHKDAKLRCIDKKLFTGKLKLRNEQV
jgi:hypothetical protein